MAIDTSRIRDNIRKLRKALKTTRKSCTPDQVHKLRTRAKTFEASTEAFPFTSKRRLRRIQQALKRIRRKAGDVRDMDVLTSHLSTVPTKDEQDCVVQLFEHLGAERYKQASRLRSLARKFGPDLRKQLKIVAKSVEQLNGKLSSTKRKRVSTEAAGFALRLCDDLQQPATLNRSNLHEYRLKIKELGSVLKMADNDAQKNFVDALNECKDAIGEWHDWEELIAITDNVLYPGHTCTLKRQLMEISASKLHQALSITNKMRGTYVDGAGRTRKHDSSGSKTRTIRVVVTNNPPSMSSSRRRTSFVVPRRTRFSRPSTHPGGHKSPTRVRLGRSTPRVPPLRLHPWVTRNTD
jgi:CHAD domain-containing protein